MTDSLLMQGKADGWNLNEEGNAAVIKNADYATQFDQASTTIAYLGKAILGSATSGAVWQIKKITFAASGGVTVQYADGNNLFDNIWDNRAALAYS